MSSEVVVLNPKLAWHQAKVYSTNTGIVLKGDQALIVDACLTQNDFARLAGFLADYRLVGGLVTHAHWDHCLWSELLGRATPRYASRATLAAMQARRAMNEAQMRELEALNFNGREYWQRDLLYQEEPLDEGSNILADFAFEVFRLDGHCQGSSAFLFHDEKVLFVGDHLSDIEPPSLDDTPGALEAYLHSLDLMERLIGQTESILPGHGSPAEPSEAIRRLEADRHYLQALSRLERADLMKDLDKLGHKLLDESPDPRAETAWGWELHQENLKILRSALS